MSEEPAPVEVPLPEPRPLTPAEAATLAALAAHTGRAELRAQAAAAVVTGVCSCGCPSVYLRCDGPVLSTVDMVAHSGNGRDDWFAVHAYHGDMSNGGTQVTLHVMSGRIGELEVYAGDGVVVDMPSPEQLTEFEVY